MLQGDTAAWLDWKPITNQTLQVPARHGHGNLMEFVPFALQSHHLNGEVTHVASAQQKTGGKRLEMAAMDVF